MPTQKNRTLVVKDYSKLESYGFTKQGTSYYFYTGNKGKWGTPTWTIVIDSDRTLELFKNWHNRVKGLKGKKYSTWWWTKTANPSGANLVRTIYAGGSLYYDYAGYGHGCVPACVPINESNNPRVPNE